MEQLFSDLEVWMAAAGVWAYIVAPAVMAAVAVLPIPAEAPAMINGALFGPVVGTAMSWLGAMLGAWISFELARAWGRPLAARFLSPSALAKTDDAVSRAGWWGMLVARFIPLIAFTALNWGAGLTAVGRWRFLWTTGVGILPGAIVFTASGTGLAMILKRAGPVGSVLAIATLVVLAIWIVLRQRREPA